MEPHELDPDPLQQIAAWLGDAHASEAAQPEAAALATAGADGSPSVRMVLLKGVDERGLAFYTNTESRKALELAARPRAALCLYWAPLHRQVRAEGTVARMTDAEALAYFATRPRGSRIAAWASPQSRPVESREELERLVAAADARHPGEDVPLPPHWGGYRLRPDVVELWAGRPNRLHDRVRYERTGAGWTRVRLAP